MRVIAGAHSFGPCPCACRRSCGWWDGPGRNHMAAGGAAARKPVIAAVNDIDDRVSPARPACPGRDGHRGRTVHRARHPAGSAPVRIAWFPGPRGAGWVSFVEQGFRAAIAGSAAEIVTTLYGDTGLEQQVLLVEQALEQRPDIDYLVGSGPMAEAAVSILRARGLTGRVRIVSIYLSRAVYRGIIRGRIMAAPTDFPVEQGRLSGRTGPVFPVTKPPDPLPSASRSDRRT